MYDNSSVIKIKIIHENNTTNDDVVVRLVSITAVICVIFGETWELPASFYISLITGGRYASFTCKHSRISLAHFRTQSISRLYYYYK